MSVSPRSTTNFVFPHTMLFNSGYIHCVSLKRFTHFLRAGQPHSSTVSELVCGYDDVGRDCAIRSTTASGAQLLWWWDARVGVRIRRCGQGLRFRSSWFLLVCSLPRAAWGSVQVGVSHLNPDAAASSAQPTTATTTTTNATRTNKNKNQQEPERTNQQPTTTVTTTIVGNSHCFYLVVCEQFSVSPCLCVTVSSSVHDVSRTRVFVFMRTLLTDMTRPCIWHGSRSLQTSHFKSVCRSFASKEPTKQPNNQQPLTNNQ